MIPDQYLTSRDDASIYPAEDMVSLLLENATRFEDKVLYILLDDGQNESVRITYGEVIGKAKAIAASLQKIGKKGDLVLLLFPSGIEFIISLYACFLAGMVAIPAYPPRRKKVDPRFLSILHDARPSVILATTNIHKDLGQLEVGEAKLDMMKMITYEDIDFDSPGPWINPEVTKDDLVLLQYTSGSTGNPKGVMVSHENMIHNSECIKQSFGFDENLIGVNWLPNFHDMGLIGCLIQPAYVGGMNIIIPPLRFLQHPLNWFKSISKYKATNAGGPNFAFDYCTEKISSDEITSLDLGSLTTMFNGSEPIRKESIERFSKTFSGAGFSRNQIFPCYGMAETVLITTGGDFQAEPVYFSVDTKAIEENKVIPAQEGKESRVLTACGFPWLGMSVTIVNPETRIPSPKGEIGEIWAKGPSVTKGYWNKAEETENIFNAFIAGTDNGPWLRTGDLGFIHGGQLYVSGRLKDLIIIRGSNFFPNDIEHSVENCHQALRKNASVAFSEDIAGEERLIIIQEVERAQMHDFNENEVFESIKSAVFADHGIQPNIIILVRMGSILKTSSGKTKRFAMRRMWKDNELNILASWEIKPEKEKSEAYIGYRPEFLREWMINWMANKLEINPDIIDTDKPVSSYGLDSITAVSLERDVNLQFGVEWPIESFLKENSINQLVKEGMDLLAQVGE